MFFNDPIPVPNPALQAVQTALDMRTAIGSLTEKWRRMGHELGLALVSRTDLRRLAPLALKDVSIMQPSERYPMSRLDFATKPSPGKS